MQPKKCKECFWTVLQHPVGSIEVGTGFRTAWLQSSVQDLAPSNKTSASLFVCPYRDVLEANVQPDQRT